jgi:hypothetical protein
MNKWIADKFIEGHIARVVNLIFLPIEAGQIGPTDGMENFQQMELSKICNLMNWQDGEETKKRIKDNIAGEDYENLAMFLVMAKKYGFIAEVNIPVRSSFSIKKDGSVGGSSFSDGYCHIDWLYADSIEELEEKLQALEDSWEIFDFEKWQKTLKPEKQDCDEK